MATNYVEEAIIRKIDAERAGIDMEQVQWDQEVERKHRAFITGMVELAMKAGASFLEQTDVELEEAAQGYSFLIAGELAAIESLSRRAALSRRRMRALPEGSLLRDEILRREARVKTLDERRALVLNCVASRRFLKEQPKLIALYHRVKFNRTSCDLASSMEKLRELFPASPRAAN